MYEQASGWAAALVRGATGKLDEATPCEGWNVRTLISHMIDTQHYFASKARGEDAALPSPSPPDLVGDDPVEAFDAARADTLDAFKAAGGADKAGFAVGVAFTDSLIHGWDLATATGQDATMPYGLAIPGYEIVHGKFTDEQRKGIFGPEITIDESASPQDKLLAYSGRQPR